VLGIKVKPTASGLQKCARPCFNPRTGALFVTQKSSIKSVPVKQVGVTKAGAAGIHDDQGSQYTPTTIFKKFMRIQAHQGEISNQLKSMQLGSNDHQMRDESAIKYRQKALVQDPYFKWLFNKVKLPEVSLFDHNRADST